MTSHKAVQDTSTSTKIIKIPGANFEPDSRGIGYFFYERMLANQEKVAQIYGPTGEKDTHGELLQRSIRLAIAMRKHGVNRGDFVSNCTFNHFDSGTPIIASFFIGAIMAAVDPTLSLEETVLLLKQTPPKLIFVTPEALEMIEKAIETLKCNTKIIVYGKSKKHLCFSDFTKSNEEEINFRPIEVKNTKETAIIFFTSGTSGLPKSICLSHHSILSAYEFFTSCGYDNTLVFNYATPYWAAFLSTLSCSIMLGSTRLIYPKFDFNNTWGIFKYKVTFAFFNTVQILIMLSQGRPKNLDLSSVKDVILGGGSIMLSQMLEAKEVFPEARVHMIYGQSEVVGPLLLFRPNNEKDLVFINEKPSSTGTPVPGIAYKIVDPETERILGLNEEGELRVRTDWALNGYHNMDSSEIWDSDGFLKTGDVAYYDEDLCFYVVDRIKEMFKFQGWHVAPAIIESVLLKHPSVEIAVVIGKPHEIDGDHPMGLVKLKRCHEATPEAIEKYVEERVHDRQRLRAGVKIVDGFPTTASGKVSRKKLRELVVNGEI